MNHSLRRVLPVLCVALCCSALQVMAQNSFKVIAVRGTASTTRIAKLAIGQQVSVSDKLTVADGSYVGLVHTNGRTIEIRKAGSYPMRELETAATKKSGSVNSKFASYVVDELTETNDPIVFKDKHRANMRVTGAVERAAGDDVNAVDSLSAAVGGLGEAQYLASLGYASITASTSVMAIMPRTTRLLTDTVMFSWHREPTTTEYRLRINDRSGSTVVDLPVRDTTVTVALTQRGLTPGSLYQWHVERADKPAVRSDDYGLYIVNGADRTATLAVLQETSSEMLDEGTSLNKLIMAQAYEDQGLIYDAYRMYRDVMQAEPNVRNYKRMFAEFLRRHDLNIEAYEVFQ